MPRSSTSHCLLKFIPPKAMSGISSARVTVLPYRRDHYITVPSADSRHARQRVTATRVLLLKGKGAQLDIGVISAIVYQFDHFKRLKGTTMNNLTYCFGPISISQPVEEISTLLYAYIMDKVPTLKTRCEGCGQKFKKVVHNFVGPCTDYQSWEAGPCSFNIAGGDVIWKRWFSQI